jgi:hypothetical protein
MRWLGVCVVRRVQTVLLPQFWSESSDISSRAFLCSIGDHDGGHFRSRIFVRKVFVLGIVGVDECSSNMFPVTHGREGIYLPAVTHPRFAQQSLACTLCPSIHRTVKHNQSAFTPCPPEAHDLDITLTRSYLRFLNESLQLRLLFITERREHFVEARLLRLSPEPPSKILSRLIVADPTGHAAPIIFIRVRHELALCQPAAEVERSTWSCADILPVVAIIAAL